MVSQYVNLYFPLCSLVIYTVLIIIFFGRRKIKTEDNYIYAELLICGFIESLFMFGTNLCVCLFYEPKYDFLFEILNKVLYSMYIICHSALFVYIYHISKNKKLNNKILILINTILIGFIFATPIEFYYENNFTNSYGASANVLYFGCTIYLVAMLALTIFNFKHSKNKKKYIPFFILMTLMDTMMIIRLVDPLLNLSSNIWSLSLLVMYFTIENPDIKLLEEAHRAKEISDNASEEKTLFLYNMTQDIRSITGKIDDDADVILDSKEISEIHDIARDIKALTSKFTSMTNEILDVGTIDSANMKTYNNKYNVKSLIKQLVNVYGDICKNKDLTFRTNIDHDIPDNLYGDGINLKEILNTILSNSAKYTNSGYVELSVNTIVKNDICRLIIIVEDSGTGIKSEDINKIKLDNKSLSKANKLITTMGGTMLISSDYGVGTKVKVILDQKIVEGEVTEISKYESTFDNISILAVDDSESGLKIIEKLLKGTNIKLDMANNGKECLDKIRVGKYDLILLDEELSQIKGSELLLKMKEVRNFNIPVILLTKDNSYDYNEESDKLGFADYILKPLKKEELLSKIDKYTKKDKE